MAKRHEAIEQRAIETTLWELANAIRDVTRCDDEAFAVLESMLAGGRISLRRSVERTSRVARGRALRRSPRDRSRSRGLRWSPREAWES